MNATAGRPINGLGAAIARTAKAYCFKVIENLGSHGVGRALHEAPCRHGNSDGWARAGTRGNLSAQQEHTMIVTKGALIIVMQH